jgi:hypothetical protein
MTAALGCVARRQTAAFILAATVSRSNGRVNRVGIRAAGRQRQSRHYDLWVAK